METPHTIRFTRRNLPHWLVADTTYFVTLRLAGTLPKQVVRELQDERSQLAQQGSDDAKALELQRRQFARVEAILDSCVSERRWLIQRDIAPYLISHLGWLAAPARGWSVNAAVVMANHIHLVLRNHAGRSGELLSDLAQYKRQTARHANRILNRSGAFWAREDFDHWCRNEEKVVAAIRYIANNPVKAGLVRSWRDWPWTKIGPESCVRAQLD